MAEADFKEDRIVRIGDKNQIFIDGRFVESRKNVQINVQSPQAIHEWCIESGTYSRDASGHKLMDGIDVPTYQSIYESDGIYKRFQFASTDGVRWKRATKEILDSGDFSYGLSRVVFFSDPTAPPEKRYKCMSGNDVLASKDGLRWTKTHINVWPEKALFPYGMDSNNIYFYDEDLKKYLAYVRVNRRDVPPPSLAEYYNGPSEWGPWVRGAKLIRCVGRSETEDLSSFPVPQIVLGPDELDPFMDGMQVMDFYTPEVNKYPHAQDAYFMFPNRFLHYQDWYIADDLTKYKLSDELISAGPMDIGFAASRNGIHWERYDRKPLIPNRQKGEFDNSYYPVHGLIAHGDELWLYYTDSPGHLEIREGIRFRNVMYRAVFRRDGFTGVEADYSGGEFTTPPLTFKGEALHLNIDTSATGLARVEILDENDRPFDGYTLEECDRIHTTNSTNRTVTWRKGRYEVGDLSGKPVRLRFELSYGVKLYAFRFGKK